MSLKGISWIEQHVEKVFAGVMGVALLGVLTWQFVGPQNTVKVGKKSDVPMPQAYDEVATAARDVSVKIERPTAYDEIAGRDTVKGGERLTNFIDHYNGKVAPDEQLAGGVLGTRPAGLGVSKGLNEANRAAVAEISVPAPGTPTAAAQLTCVHPVELYGPDVTVQIHKAVAAVLPPELPYDKAGVSVETTFDAKALKTQLESDPDGAGPIRAIPGHWWRDRVEILAVEMERQVLNADGSWGEEEVVTPIPGRMSLRPDMKEKPTSRELTELVNKAKVSLAAVRRPTYYKSLIGASWRTPSQTLADKGKPVVDASEVSGLQGQRSDLRKKIDAVNKLIQQEGAGGAGKPGGGAVPPAGAGAGAGGGAGGGGKRDNNKDKDKDKNKEKEKEKEREKEKEKEKEKDNKEKDNKDKDAKPAAGSPKAQQLQRQLERYQKELQSVEEQLRALGVLVEGEQTAQPPVQQPTTPEATDQPLLSADSVRLWAHDVTAERGKTYRYRLSVWINNPVYGFAANLPAQQAQLAETAYLKSAPSAWSSPVRVDDETYFFVTSASEDSLGGGPVGGGGGLGAGAPRMSPSAMVELFEFRWGAWRKAAARFEPGDTLVAKAKVPDLMPKAVAIEAVLRGQIPPAAAPGDGGRGNTPPAGEGGGNAGGAGAPPAVDPKGTLVEDGVKLVDLTISRETVLLDVAPAALSLDGRSRPNEAILRDKDGQVIQRVPEVEKQSAVYREVSRVASGEPST